MRFSLVFCSFALRHALLFAEWFWPAVSGYALATRKPMKAAAGALDRLLPSTRLRPVLHVAARKPDGLLQLNGVVFIAFTPLANCTLVTRLPAAPLRERGGPQGSPGGSKVSPGNNSTKTAWGWNSLKVPRTFRTNL